MFLLFALLYLFALVCFVLATFGYNYRRVNLVALGLAFVTLAFFLSALARL